MIHYDAWYRPTDEELRREWESEWDKMRYFLDTDYFDKEENFMEVFTRYSSVVSLTKDMGRRIARRSHTQSIEQLEAMVATYRSAARRKGVPQKLATMMQNNEPLPMPIIAKRSGKVFVIGGNTRLDVAEILDVRPDPKVLFVNLDDPMVAHLDDDISVEYD